MDSLIALSQIVTDQGFFGAKVDAAVRKNGTGPAGIKKLGYLEAGKFDWFFGGNFEKTEEASFAEDN
jgi:hypothetical protein